MTDVDIARAFRAAIPQARYAASACGCYVAEWVGGEWNEWTPVVASTLLGWAWYEPICINGRSLTADAVWEEVV